jgi:hypothetical protein
MPNQFMKNQTICWDCSRATGGCSWVDHFVPVAGWQAVPKKMKLHNGIGERKETGSYVVSECPDFIRDAYNFGLKRAE